MRPFADHYARAAARKGGDEALEALIPRPKAAAVLSRIGDDRWLAEMTRSVFQAGFVWRVVDAKWPAFERAFQAFDPYAVAYLSDDAIDALLADAGIIRHHGKLLATRANAQFILELAAAHGSAASYFASIPAGAGAYVGLLQTLKKGASRLGGVAAQYFLRRMGVDSFILSPDVVKVLIADGVVPRPPASKSDMAAVQAAFDVWCRQSGRDLTAVSRVLAMSTA